MKFYNLAGFLLIGAAVGPFSTLTSYADVVVAVPLAESLKDTAKEAFEDGKRLYELKDYVGAGVKFRVALKQSDDYRLLKSIAACERAQLHYAQAYNLLAKYLLAGKGKLPADQITSAEDTMGALKSFFSLISATIEPANASVKVDGVEIGKSPVAPFAVDLGTHKVTVDAAGYEPFEKVLDVPGKTEIPLTIALVKVPVGHLLVTAGSGDAIAVDGSTSALGKFEGDLKPGGHIIRVTGAGKKPYEERLELAAGSTRTLSVTLVNDKSGVPTWLWLAGGVVVAGGLTVGGYFLLKPGDTPGKKLEGGLGTASFGLSQGLRF